MFFFNDKIFLKKIDYFCDIFKNMERISHLLNE